MNNSFTRRDFLKLSSISLLAGLAGCTGLKITEEIPSSIAPPFSTDTLTPVLTPSTSSAGCSLNEEFYNRLLTLEGERYTANVPDTLDFQRHAELSLNALTRCTNPDADYSVYFYGKANRNPPILTDADVEPNPTSFNGKFSEATLMMRQMTGLKINEQVDQVWRAKFLRWLAQSNPCLVGPDLGRLLAWLALIYQIEGDECYRQLGEKAIQQMLLQSKMVDDYRYFPGSSGTKPKDREIVNHSWTLQGIAHFYQVTGYLPAKQLGTEIAHYLKDHSGMFDANGRFLFYYQNDGHGNAVHFHSNGNAMLAIAEMATMTGDQELAGFARQGYEYARTVGTPLVGFFPEYIPAYSGQLPYIDCESCCIADMVLLALFLTKTGQSDYWDDIDRYVRNQLVENHMASGTWIEKYSTKLPLSPIPDGTTGDNVSERGVGSFSGWSSANEYLIDMNQPLVSACCTGNGSRAFYYIWQNMLSFNQGRLTINLMFNRASRWADINSYIPYDGRINVQIKENCDLELRLPEWVNPEETSGAVNSTPVKLSFSGRYARFGQVQRGDIATLSFPISERSMDTFIGDQIYSLTIKGNDVVDIHPSGILYPFYQRSHYRHRSLPWWTHNAILARLRVSAAQHSVHRTRGILNVKFD